MGSICYGGGDFCWALPLVCYGAFGSVTDGFVTDADFRNSTTGFRMFSRSRIEVINCSFGFSAQLLSGSAHRLCRIRFRILSG